MKFLLILAVALFSSGFVMPETTGEKAERERHELHWRDTLLRRYDLSALALFLRKTVRSQHAYQKIDLTKSKVDSKWHVSGDNANCGDWALYLEDPSQDTFLLEWTYEWPPAGESGVMKSVVFTCHRISRGHFKKIGIVKREDQEAVISP